MRARPLIDLLMVLGFARFVVLGVYMHPYADDWSYAYTAFDLPLLERLFQEYVGWNGRVASNLLVLRGPLVLGLDDGLVLYRCLPAVWIVGMVTAWVALFRALQPLGVQRQWGLPAALGFTTLWLNTLPDLTEGLYWYTGTVTYTLPQILLVHLAAVSIRLRYDTHAQGQARWYLLAALLGVWIMWSNEVHLALVLMGTVAFVIDHKRKCRDIPVPLSILMLLYISAAMITFLAPGNAARAAQFTAGGDVLFTLWMTVLQTGRFLLSWVLSPAITLATIVVLALLRRSERAPMVPWRWYTVAFVIFLAVAMCMVLPYWATGMLGQHRTVNVGWSVFLPLWVILVMAIEQQVLRPGRYRLPTSRRAIIAPVIGLVLALLVGGNDGRVASDLLMGAAAANDRAWTMRYRAIEDAHVQRVTDIRFDRQPGTAVALKVLELNTDPEHWTNRSLVRYLKADEIRVSILPATQ
ncbi:MAG TPA: DUF6056 family protein [Flavobacteriales bacterium]|jgi:hypothetical protein|nr:DUF6056 family protein [Flavobacteriales bacterium]